MGGSRAFSHGHFAHGRNVKGNESKEFRGFERSHRAKTQRHSEWKSNKAQQRLQRDMRSVQRRFEDMNLWVYEIRTQGNPFEQDIHCCDSCAKLLKADERGEWYDAYGNEYVPEEIWRAEQEEQDSAAHDADEEGSDEEEAESATPASTCSSSSTSSYVFTPPASPRLDTPPLTRTPSPVTRFDEYIPAQSTRPRGFEDDFILFDDGTGSEIDFDNMSDIDPLALEGMF